MTTPRAELSHFLAEALAEPPEWLALPGREWPLSEIAIHLAATSEFGQGGLDRAIHALASVSAEDLAGRRGRYAALFSGPGRPRFWLYESAFLTGRLLGPESFAVERLYRAAGLAPEGAELPDHASIELEFLALLAEVDTDSARSKERHFIESHAGRWLPQLGRALAHSGDAAYGPIGQLLASVWETGGERPVAGDVEQPLPAGRRPRSGCTPALTRLPFVADAQLCTLCGFCVQACPTRALFVDETRETTSLVLRGGSACTGCGKCERVCEPHALQMGAPLEDSEPSRRWSGGRRVLRQSPRVACPGCGAPTVSRAELNFVAARIGHPAWLDHCLECRASFQTTSPETPP